MDNPTAEKIETLCSNCGGKLSYAPGTTSLKCEYCGTVNEIKVADTPIEKQDLRAFLDSQVQTAATMEVVTVKCDACSAQTTFDKGVTAGNCAFCGNNLVVAGATTQSIIKPKSLLPFKIDRNTANEDFRKWLDGLWWAPSDLKKYAQNDKLNGVYLPFWTYDAETSATYVGERGIDIEVPVERTVTDDDGNESVETVMEIRTEWWPAFGTVNNDFDDVLVVGSRSLPPNHQDSLQPWDLNDLVPFDERFISGFKAESYQVDVKEGWAIAETKIAGMVEDSIRYDIGGNHQRIISYNINYGDLSFKHILLPIWISAYRYNNKVYRFIVNGRTGQVSGERPYSTGKIVLAIVVGLLILFLLYTLFVHNGGGGGGSYR